MKTLLLSLLVVSPVLASPVPKDENVSLLLEGQNEITSLNEIDRLGLSSGHTKLDLWSGSYWPHYQGLIGARYRDAKYHRLMDSGEQFDKFKKLIEEFPIYRFTGNENNLSPAEKYDLLVGDPEMSLTKYSWETANKASVGGSVKTWRGLCDGWASASQKMPRPVKSVNLRAANGTPLTFYPEDLKALGSLMYARSQGPVIFLGKRCRSQALGLFTNACDETNPGTFHRALINRVGKLKKTFIADIAPGGQVWNYPVKSYKVTYYNVFNNEESIRFQDVEEVFTKKKKFAKKNTRHKSTHSIVGVKIDVQFMDMRDANLLENDGIQNDRILEKQYLYDLELDRNKNILGGESFSRNLPDFIWAPNDKTYPLSDVEELMGNMSVVQMSQTAAKKGQPLSQVIEKLFKLSSED